MKVSVITLGCKVNQYESDAIVQELKKLGHDASTKLLESDLYILNTCAVTNEAEHKSREFVAKCNKLNPNGQIIICGCASQHNAEQFLKIKNVKSVIGTAGKNKISDILSSVGNLLKPITKEYENFNEVLTTRTRAFLKVQDGCDYYCSYCIIPYVRGRSRSRDLASIHAEAVELAKHNKEIVVTGINVTDYRIDNKPALPILMRSLSDIPARIRLSSFEVNAIDETLLQTLKDMPNFCPQFHLSLQSGCDRILKLMNRRYTVQEYLQKLELIRQYFPDASFSTDLIVGFPTETEEDFLETLETVKTANFFFIHIFPYSERHGTVAEKLKKVDYLVVKDRVRRLKCLERELNLNYITSHLGTTQRALTESVKGDYMIGHTEQFVKVYLPKTTPRHELIEVVLTQPYLDGCIAKTK